MASNWTLWIRSDVCMHVCMFDSLLVSFLPLLAEALPVDRGERPDSQPAGRDGRSRSGSRMLQVGARLGSGLPRPDSGHLAFHVGRRMTPTEEYRPPTRVGRDGRNSRGQTRMPKRGKARRGTTSLPVRATSHVLLAPWDLARAGLAGINLV